VKAINALRFVKAAGGSDLVIPEGGWNRTTFAQHGAALIATQHRVAKLVQRKSAAIVARIAKRFYDGQLERIIDKGLSNHGVSTGKSFVTFDVVQNERLWLNAISEVLAESGLEIKLELHPTIQSTAGQGYSRTNILLGESDTAEARRNLATKIEGIADKVVSVNETTRKRIEKRVKESVSKGDTVTETAQLLRREIPPINSGRALTVARTEMSNAWNAGSVEAFQNCEKLTHVSVIGCEYREWDAAPQFFYNDEPTCNIEDVPVEDCGELEFHPNHTGVMVASKFKD
jgi:hypothetical protein